MLIELSDEFVSSWLLKPIPLEGTEPGELRLKLEVWKKCNQDAFFVWAWRLDSYRLLPTSASTTTLDAADVEIFVADDFINAKLEALSAKSAREALAFALEWLQKWFGDKLD
ncbi:MAG: hypothetical protein ACAI34_05315 [Verrucomicrobium sp.]|nr:hypothetical protein [Verrucomicrobium sp.]